MRARHPFPVPAGAPFPGADLGSSLDSQDPAGADPAPANRAARRGRAKGRASSGAVRTGSDGRTRAAQGRRINPVRRTG